LVSGRRTARSSGADERPDSQRIRPARPDACVPERDPIRRWPIAASAREPGASALVECACPACCGRCGHLEANIVKFLVELIGWTGALLVLLAYALLTLQRVTSISPSYRWLNVAGSAGLVANAVWYGAFPSAFLNVVWLAITLYSLAKG
jgi:hypothetical protein